MGFLRRAYPVTTDKYDDHLAPAQARRDGPVSGTKGRPCPTCGMTWRTWTEEDGHLYRICVQGHREYFGESS